MLWDHRERTPCPEDHGTDPFYQSAGLADLFAWPGAELQRMVEDRNTLVTVVDDFEAI